MLLGTKIQARVERLPLGAFELPKSQEKSLLFFFPLLSPSLSLSYTFRRGLEDQMIDRIP
jgi:ABC-type uncharacterized transport system permease subunit